MTCGSTTRTLLQGWASRAGGAHGDEAEAWPDGRDAAAESTDLVDVVVRSKNLQVPTTLRSSVQRKLQRLERIAPDALRADVHLSEERNPRIAGRFVCTVTVQLRHGVMAAHGAAAEPAAAVDLVLEKLRHQAARLKDQRVRRATDARRRAGRAGTRS